MCCGVGGKTSHVPKARRHDMLRLHGQAMQAKVESLVRRFDNHATKEVLDVLVGLSGVDSKCLDM